MQLFAVIKSLVETPGLTPARRGSALRRLAARRARPVLGALLAVVLLTRAVAEPPLKLEHRLAPDRPNMKALTSPDWAEPAPPAPAEPAPAITPKAFGVIAPAARQPAGALSGRIVFCNGGHGWTYDPAYPWRLLRGTLHEMNEDHGNVDQLNFFALYCFNAGAVVVPFRPIGQQTNEVVLDNADAAVTFSGAWSDSTSPIFYGAAGKVPYRFASLSATETATATYTPTFPRTDYYPVYTWVRHGVDRGDQLYCIRHTGGESQVRIPHHLVGNGWVYLGEYYFNAGSNAAVGAVVISNLRGTPTGGVVIADAIRFGNGMGSTDNGAGGSGYPRECESARYWIKNSLGQGQSTSLYDGSGNDESDSWSAPPKMSAEMNREAAGSTYDRIHISFHSNASSGTARGTVALITTTQTPNQTALANTAGGEVTDDLVALGSPPLEAAWYNRSTHTYSGGYSEIDGSLFNNEMDATIIEVAFHDNVTDAQLMRDSKARAAVGKAAMHAVIKHLHAFNTNNPPPLAYLPEPPTNLRATAGANGAITLAWTAPVALGGSQNPTNYTLYRSTNGYGFGNPVYVGNVTTYTVTGLAADVDYYFRVAASNAGGESMPSEVVGCRASSVAGARKALVVNAFDRFDRTTNLRQDTTRQSYVAPDGTGTIERVFPRRVNAFDYVVQYGKSLSAYGMAFDSCQRQAVTSGAINLANYPVVIWQAGQTQVGTFGTAGQTQVAAFLNGGGNLFVSGAKIAYDLDRASGPSAADRTFLKNQLHADLTADANTNAASYTFAPAAGSIFAGNASGTYDNGSKGIYWVQTADVVSPSGAGASAALNYTANANGAAAIQYDGSSGGGKVVYLAFPFETITSATVRHAYMADVLGFFEAIPPAIVAQPRSLTATQGMNVTFTVSVSGSVPLRYQWRFNGTNLAGATLSSYTRNNVQASDAGTYSASITNAAGATNSDEAVLTVIVPPFVSTQPASVVTGLGLPASFNVSADGTPPLSYQWRLNGIALDGATTNSFSLESAQATDAGSYTVLVSSPYGSVTSAVAVLTLPDPYLASQPADQSVDAGATAAFTVSAVGTAPLAYYWRKEGMALADGDNLSGTQSPTLSVSAVQGTDMGNYSVLVSNANGAVVSSNATLVAPFAPTLLSQPLGQKAAAGSTAAFTVAAAGPGPLSYQWKRDGTNLADTAKLQGAATASLRISNVQAGEVGNYSVVVSNLHGQTVSASALLAEWPLAAWGNNTYGQADIPADLTNAVAVAAGTYHSVALLADGSVAAWGAGKTSTITSPNFGQSIVPANLTNAVAVAAGAYHTLAVKADGSVAAWGAGYTNPWTSFHYGQSIVPEGLTNATAAAGGLYHSLVLRADGAVLAWGAGTNNTGTSPHLGQSAVPAGLSRVVAIAAGTFHSLALQADGTVVGWGAGTTNTGASPHYGQASVPADLSNVVAIAAGSYHSLALQADGTVVAWGLNQNGQANVPAGLGAVAIAAGANYSLALQPDGTTVAWGGNNYGQTSLLSGLAHTVALAAGAYHPAVLQNDGQPHFLVQPAGRACAPGQTATLRALAVGSQPLSFQWQHNGADLPGATANSLTLTNLQAGNAGTYSLAATNAAGFALSSAAVLTVLPALPFRFDLITVLPDNTVKLVLGGEPGSYALEQSANLLQWLPWTNVSITNGPVEVYDSDATNRPQRFYRAVR